MTSQLALAVLLGALSASAYPTGGRDKQHASWDDVNVVAHGLLQLGQALKEHVDKSKAQMKELNAGLRGVNGTLQRLEQDRVSQEQDRVSQEQDRVSQEQDRVSQEQDRVSQEQRKELSDRMDRLEQQMEEVLGKLTLDSNSSDDADVPFVQRMMAVQDRRIDQLLEKVKQQQNKLEKQNVHLRALQIKVGQKRMKAFRRRQDQMVHKEEAVHKEGGWTIIQKRSDSSQSVDPAWNDYSKVTAALRNTQDVGGSAAVDTPA